jgi:hypothetical protein
MAGARERPSSARVPGTPGGGASHPEVAPSPPGGASHPEVASTTPGGGSSHPEVASTTPGGTSHSPVASPPAARLAGGAAPHPPVASTPAARLAGPASRFALAAVLAWVATVATWFLLVATEAGQLLENAALRGAALRTEADREAVLNRLSDLSLVLFAFAVVAVFLVGIARRRGGLGSVAAATMVVSVLAVESLKVGLPRPELVEGPVWLLRNSFPSGTAAVAAAIAVGVLLVAPDRVRWLVLPAGALFAGIVVDAVQRSGWHRFSDAIGGVLVVIGVAAAGLALLAGVGLVRRSSHGFVDRRVRNATSLPALLMLATGAAVLLLLAAFPLLSEPPDTRRALLQTALPLVGAGLTIVALVGFGRLVEPFALGVERASAEDGEAQRTTPMSSPPSPGPRSDTPRRTEEGR